MTLVKHPRANAKSCSPRSHKVDPAQSYSSESRTQELLPVTCPGTPSRHVPPTPCFNGRLMSVVPQLEVFLSLRELDEGLHPQLV